MKLKLFLKKCADLIEKVFKLMLNWRFLLCFGIAWMITNGWAYIFIALGPMLNISWMTIVGISYVSFLWMPFTPEKLITIPLAIFFVKWLFPKDEKTKKELESIKIKKPNKEMK